MKPEAIILATAAVGLVVNLIGVVGIFWRGGRVIGRMEETVRTVAEEVSKLRDSRDEQNTALARWVAQFERVVIQLDRLEVRVEVLEQRRVVP